MAMLGTHYKVDKFYNTVQHSIYDRKPDGTDSELSTKEGDQGNVWNRQMVDILDSTTTEDFRIVFRANIGKQFEGDIAVDDIVFSPECRYIHLAGIQIVNSK